MTSNATVTSILARHGFATEPDESPGPRAPRSLPDAFWTARPVLRHIRQAAHADCCSADAVLHALLARISAGLPGGTTVDTGVRGPASLNYYAALVGPPGSGKTSGAGTARRLLADDPINPLPEHPLGSGEGIAESYMGVVEMPDGPDGKMRKARQQTKYNALFVADEGELLSRLLERSGATIGETLRRGWMGETLGQYNAEAERARKVAAGTYSLGLVVGFQPDAAGKLLKDAPLGTPQRFVWASSVDQNIPEHPVAHPGMLPYRCSGRTTAVTMTEPVRTEIRRVAYRRAIGEQEPAELDAHDILTRAKVAALLALLDGRRVADDVDWFLAVLVWDTSCAVRDDVLDLLAEHQDRQHRVRTDQYVDRETAAEAARRGVGAKIDRIARGIARRVHADGTTTRGYAYRALASRDRSLFDQAVEHAAEQHWITDDGDTLTPGSVPPPEQ